MMEAKIMQFPARQAKGVSPDIDAQIAHLEQLIRAFHSHKQVEAKRAFLGFPALESEDAQP